MDHDRHAVSGNIVDSINGTIYPGTLIISEGVIVDIIRKTKAEEWYIIPGFIDSHIHIESSMLTPSEFARTAMVHGTVAAVADPHEIANVLGIDGVMYMIDDGSTVPMKFYFSAPSCVPATPFETSGAALDGRTVDELLRRNDIRYLGEMMNYPGVIHHDPDVMEKIAAAKKYGKPIDGHAPGLTGGDLIRYVNAGISTNHEALSREEALEDIRAGMMIQIRKGSAADIFEEFLPLLNKHHDSCMFCSDDKHPDDLIRGYLNDMVRDAVAHGVDVIKVLRAASLNPVRHYNLDVGLLRVGDPADFLVVDTLRDFNILKTYIGGVLVAGGGKAIIPRKQPRVVNKFTIGRLSIDAFTVPAEGDTINVIEAVDGQVITNRGVEQPKVENGHAVADTTRDILKVAVVNRYVESPPALGFIKHFGLKRGAIASSVAHDSHNIVAVGTNDDDLRSAVNRVIDHKGGICAVDGGRVEILPLPVAGIMSDDACSVVAERYTVLERMAHSMGSTLRAPFMTLSFMALPVIPKLKITDRGLFDGDAFHLIPLFNKRSP